jgi:predicted dehydrogenase
VGYGYWGPNLARNFREVPECRLLAVCDQSDARLEAAARSNPGCQTTHSYQDLLRNPAIHAIAVATPVTTHYELARQALLAGKDVLVEKPMTHTLAEAESLVELARQTGRIVAVDHTFLFTEAVRKIKELVDDGSVGKLLYIDSVRTNLGLFHPDHNVILDLAPHEVSIMLYLVNREPISVQAHGVCHTNNAIENLAYLHLEFEEEFIAHFHLNWLAPVKIRQMIIAGSRQMIVYDDMERIEKVKIYNKGIAIQATDSADARRKSAINYRSGDMVAPHLENREALAVEAAHFVDCVRTRQRPLVTGEDGLRVVRILQAAQRSLKNKGKRVDINPIGYHAQAA